MKSKLKLGGGGGREREREEQEPKNQEENPKTMAKVESPFRSGGDSDDFVPTRLSLFFFFFSFLALEALVL